ncbi:MAG TPA: hypothetical protein VGJ57_08790 [Nitrospirales bacterium]
MIAKGFLSQKISGLQSKLRDAFAAAPAEPLSPADLALLERVADAIVQRGMAAPAVLFLESLGPMNFLGSQALHFLTPILSVVFAQREVERVALLLERRDILSRLSVLIDAREHERHP